MKRFGILFLTLAGIVFAFGYEPASPELVAVGLSLVGWGAWLSPEAER